MVWDLFCRVIDNFGDIGVCWRLACDLAARGERIRLWTNDASALVWMAPERPANIEVRAWDAAETLSDVGGVVIEAFGCELPLEVVRTMAQRPHPPVWINLEHLSAEAYAARSHGLPSPQLTGPARGLVKWFFYPGFGPGTGGVIREAGLEARQARFDAAAWLSSIGLQRGDGEQLVCLFCYDDSNVPALIEALSATPTLLLATAGPAARQVRAALGSTLQRERLRAAELPWLSQLDFDHLLWACDLSFVRGEDSWVRAQWAGRPFVWQAYRQDDGAHHAKLGAFLHAHLADAPRDLAAALRAVWAGWNGAAFGPMALPVLGEWREHARHWRRSLARQPDLSAQLLGFAREKR